MQVIIIGAGLAGPALALALARQSKSIRCTILESHETVKDIGGVISLAPNAIRALSVCDIEDVLRDKGMSSDAINVHVQTSSSSLAHVGGFSTKGMSTTAVSIGRPVLHKALLDACDKFKEQIVVRHDARVATIEETDTEVTAVLQDGERIKGDILIGADGIGSRVRQHILGEKVDPVYSGVCLLGAITPVSEISLPAGWEFPAFVFCKKGTFLSFAMDKERSSVQWATSLVVPERHGKQGWQDYAKSGEAIRDLRAQYADLKMQPLRSLVDGVTNEALRIWAPYSVPELKTWHSSRCVLVGDAAHAFPPSMGQGSAQAFEDTAMLSKLLLSKTADGADYGRIFAQYESIRRPRVDAIRKATMNAEATRRPTNSELWWKMKSNGARAAFWLFGSKGGYLRGGGITNYDVTTAAVEA